MADRCGKGVGRMVGMRVVVEVEHRAHHIDDLVLVGRAGAHHRLLDLHGGVLPHLEPACEQATMAAPRAWAVASAERVFSPKKIFSMASCVGW